MAGDDTKSAKGLVGSILSNLPGVETGSDAGDEGDTGPTLTAADLAKQAMEQPAPTDPPPGTGADTVPSLPTAGEGAPEVTPAIAESVMKKLGATDEAPEEPVGEDLGVEVSEDDAAALIEVYFDLEVPEERDALLRRLMDMKLEVVTEFLRTMMNEDEDDYLRAEAAAELARRRDPEGLAAMEADLEDPEEPFFFENAMKTLCEIRGVGFYETLREMWLDPECDGDKRRDVMLGMEDIDLERALGDFVWLVESTTDIDAMLDDQIEIAMMAFVRHDHQAAEPVLRALRDRIASAAIDEDEREELVEFVQEGIDLLAGS